MWTKLPFKSRRFIWFGMPLLFLSFLLYRQSVRIRFWEQRRDKFAEALEFSGDDLRVKLVETISPNTVRLMFFVPSGRRIAALPITHTPDGPIPSGLFPTRIETTDEPGRVQLTCCCYVGEDSRSGLWYFRWLEFPGATTSPKTERRMFRLPNKTLDWKIDPALSNRTTFHGTGKHFFPVISNSLGHRIGLEIIDINETP